MPSENLTVQLGQHEYTVVPQPYAYLRHRFRSFLTDIGSGIDTDAGDIMGMIGGNAYRLLAILIPGMLPEHEFEGYSTADAYAADRESGFERGPDMPQSSPTNDQILTAIEVAATVNRLDLVKHLRNLVGGDFFKVLAQKALAEAVSSLSPARPSLPPSTASGPESSTTTSPSSDPTGSEAPTASGEPSDPLTLAE